MKLLILNNLSSGYGEGAIYDFVRAFAQSEDEVVIRSANGDSDFASMLSDAHDFDAVVASGGDGTVASVCYLLRNSGIPILVFPAGTANLLAQNIESPASPTRSPSLSARDAPSTSIWVSWSSAIPRWDFR